jgi:peptidoglycan/LPS O-acetylase OafA/YrhL
MSRRKQEESPIRNFFMRRVFRIAPMYWLGILFYTWWFARMGAPPSSWSVASNFTFLHGLSPYWINSLVPGGWSITVEMFFYCLAPWLHTKIKSTDHALRFVLCTALLAQLVSAVLLHYPLIANKEVWSDFVFLNFISQLPVFGVGILLFYLLQPGAPSALSGNTLLLLAVTLLAALTVNTLDQAQHLLFAGGFLVLAVGLSRKENMLVVNPIITYIGKISFSLYLVHFSVLYALQHWGHENFIAPTRMVAALADYAVRLLVVLSVSTLLATIFYELVEVRGQTLGKKLIAYLER